MSRGEPTTESVAGRRPGRLGWLLLAVFVAGCAGPPLEPGAERVRVVSTERAIPEGAELVGTWSPRAGRSTDWSHHWEAHARNWAAGLGASVVHATITPEEHSIFYQLEAYRTEE